MIQTLLSVAVGGALGSVLRWLVIASFGAPGMTLVVNVVGSFLMGLAYVALAGRAPAVAPFVMTGVLGGFTTFSAFSADTLRLWENGQGLAAAAYVLASVGLSLLAVAAGAGVARGMLG